MAFTGYPLLLAGAIGLAKVNRSVLWGVAALLYVVVLVWFASGFSSNTVVVGSQ